MIMKLTTVGTIVAAICVASTHTQVASAERTKKEAGSRQVEDVFDQEQDLERSLFTDGTGSDLMFQRSYIVITQSENFITLAREGTSGPLAKEGANAIIGTIQTQSGGVYDPANIKIVNKPEGVTLGDAAESSGANGINGALVGLQFAGKAQPKFVPAVDASFFFDGQCKATGGIGASSITKHSCVFNLCLGGGGFNCLNLFCGSAFIFDPFKQPGNSFKNAPNLPPSYPCVIFGGTNVFQGAEGNVDVTTLTGRTSPLNRRTVSGEDSAVGNVGQGGTDTVATGTNLQEKLGQQFGVITQRLNVVSNVPLPPAP